MIVSKFESQFVYYLLNIAYIEESNINNKLTSETIESLGLDYNPVKSSRRKSITML